MLISTSSQTFLWSRASSGRTDFAFEDATAFAVWHFLKHSWPSETVLTLNGKDKSVQEDCMSSYMFIEFHVLLKSSFAHPLCPKTINFFPPSPTPTICFFLFSLFVSSSSLPKKKKKNKRYHLLLRTSGDVLFKTLY